MMQNNSILSVRDLSVDFGSAYGVVEALRNVSFDVPPGSIIGIVGESGCGKSTLINAILGLLPSNGHIRNGQLLFKGLGDLRKKSATEMTSIRGVDISVVFQDPMNALNPVRTIGQQMRDIQYRLQASSRQKDKRSVAMLEKVRMPDAESRLRQYPHEFSGGMKQRIAIAMALLLEPQLLIADEPTTALDATLELATIEMLREIQSEMNCAILFISHHLGVISELCEQVIVMYAGEVVEKGNVSAVFDDPRHPYTRMLLACDPAREDDASLRLNTIAGEIPDLRNRPHGCIFASRCDLVIPDCVVGKPPVIRPAPGRVARCRFADEGDII